MATVAFTDTKVGVVKGVSDVGFKTSKIKLDTFQSKIKDIRLNVKKISSSEYPISKVVNHEIAIKPTSILPFRVSFSSITIDGYTAKRPAPIGIAVVGVNNYIL